MVCEKGLHFQLMQDQLIKKSFFQHNETSISHHTQTNVQQPFSNTACHCELAAKQPIFETLQSCVGTKATLSHRFKASPAIPGNLVMPDTAGYLMTACHFSENLESSGDLNRGRRTESRVLFGYFLHDAKSDNPFPLRESFEVLQTSNQHTKLQIRTNKLKSCQKLLHTFC